MPKEPKWIELELPLAELVLSDDLKVREPDKGVIAAYAIGYANSPEKFPPLMAAQIRRAYYLVDGRHRYHAAQRAGLVALPVLTAKMTQQQAASEAAKANAKHGRGVSGDVEKARVREMYFSDPSNLAKSVRAIEEDLPGIVSKSQAQRIKARLLKEAMPEKATWDAEQEAEAKQERLEQDAKAALKTLETHWGRLTSPETKRWILQLAKETVGRLSGEASRLPKSPLDI